MIKKDYDMICLDHFVCCFKKPLDMLYFAKTFVFPYRTFRIFDDDGSKSLNFSEFKKGLRDYGLHLEPDVSIISTIGFNPAKY